MSGQLDGGTPVEGMGPSLLAEAHATTKLAAVRRVLGERHERVWTVDTKNKGRGGERCLYCPPTPMGMQRWPCLHERIFRAVEGERVIADITFTHADLDRPADEVQAETRAAWDAAHRTVEGE